MQAAAMMEQRMESRLFHCGVFPPMAMAEPRMRRNTLHYKNIQVVKPKKQRKKDFMYLLGNYSAPYQRWILLSKISARKLESPLPIRGIRTLISS
jgi:hypothetical protein